MALLDGKTAIVTGSSRGIGKAIALELAREGADIVVCARTDKQEGEIPGTIGETKAAVEALGRRAIAIKADVTEDADLKRVVDETLAAFGKIDILVNNAGLTGGQPFLNGTPDVFDLYMRVNLRGPFVLSQLVAPHMVEAGGGVIVNISSGGGAMPAPPTPETAGRRSGGGGGPVYGMTKAALDRFSAGIASDLYKSNIAVITIYPGFTITERNALVGTSDPNRDMSRAEKPETTAKAVAFLLRDPMANTGRGFTSKDVVEQNGL
jgi:NAD(P)-dependent dehydrogenase (short-subunit alcohol dehydrogenase family)